ncbi:MAG: IPT/TIG domain-containing protein [Nocardioidaceae bacterium]
MGLVLLLSGLAVTVPGADAAFALPPTVLAFLPLSGPVGTSVTITGTMFTGATSVTFNGTPASFTVNLDTLITATVPAGATDGPIAVTTPGGTATSALNFDVTASPVPTILAFLPLSGPVGTSVVITGTGFTGATAVTFNGTSASFSVDLDTQITATVPAGATDGPIAVTTPGGTATSALNFDVTGTQRHERNVTLELRRHLIAVGRIRAQDGFEACEDGVTVKVQRRRPHGGWRGVGTDKSNASGVFRQHVSDRPGVYRAVAVRKEMNGATTCVYEILRRW